jgi:HEAT repeat protein
MFRNHLNPNRRPSLGMLIMLALAINGLVTLFGIIRPAHAYNQEIEKLNRFVQTSSASSDELAIFNQGRDLLADNKWEEAAGRFGQYIERYPKGKDVDAALYWLGYALTKEEKFDEADRAIARLLAEFPKSRWRRDAEGLRLQRPTRAPVNVDSIEGDDVKLVALQSLLMGNPTQGVVQANNILRNPNASRKLKEGTIALLGQHAPEQSKAMLLEIARTGSDTQMRKTAIFWIGQSNDEGILDQLKEFATSTNEEVSKAGIFAISQHHSPRADQMLADMARAGATRRQREEAIFWISQRDSAGNDDLLIQIFEADKDLQIRKKVIFALTQRHSDVARAKLIELARTASDSELRGEAIFWVGQRGDDQAADALIGLLDSERDRSVRKKLVFSLAQMNNPKAHAKLADIARGTDDPELRGETIFWLAQTGGDQTVDFLSQLYDSEKTVEVKKKILFALTQAKDRKAALHKLMAIAKSDPSPEARKEAVFWIGQSNDPEAVKFLEDILK